MILVLKGKEAVIGLVLQYARGEDDAFQKTHIIFQPEKDSFEDSRQGEHPHWDDRSRVILPEGLCFRR